MRLVDKKNLYTSLKPLPREVLERLRERMIVEFAYNSTAIEGSTLTLSETRLVICEGVTVGGKPLRDVFAARNHPEALKYVEEFAYGRSPLRDHEILTLHGLVMKDVADETGQFRTRQVQITGSRHVVPYPAEIPALIRELVEWVERNPEELVPVELAAVFHHRFEAIHPFADGNGRVGRLLMNLVLLRNGYIWTIFRKEDRAKYIRCLERADAGDPKALVNYVARQAEQDLDLYLISAMEADPGRRLKTLAEIAPSTPYSQEYLSLLARLGRIAAVKVRDSWMITEEAMREYVEAQAARPNSHTSGS